MDTIRKSFKPKANMGIVIAGFAGVGKTKLGEKYSNVIDLESSKYKYKKTSECVSAELLKGTKGRELNLGFPLNYFNAINEALDHYDFVLVSCSPDIMGWLSDSNVDFYVCYPTSDCKREYIDRYIKRGNNSNFIMPIQSNFDTMINALSKFDNRMVLTKEETLEDYLLREGYSLRA